jgi:hypothetical protein
MPELPAPAVPHQADLLVAAEDRTGDAAQQPVAGFNRRNGTAFFAGKVLAYLMGLAGDGQRL